MTREYPAALHSDKPWATESLRAFGQYGGLESFATRACLKGFCDTVLDGPILEIGAGIGYLGSLLPKDEELLARYVQTDIGPNNCQLAADLNPGIQTVCTAAQQLPFATETISGVVGRSVLDVTSTETVVRDVARVLKPGGQFVHMRHTQPSLGWIAHHYPMPSSARMMPHFDEYGRFEQYKVVDRRVLNRYMRSHDLPSLFCDPHIHATIDGDIILRNAMELHMQNIPAIEVTPRFGDIMDSVLKKMLNAAGLDATFAIATHTETMTLKEARRMGLPAGKNFWNNHAGYLEADYNPRLPKGTAEVTASIALTIASKPIEKKR